MTNTKLRRSSDLTWVQILFKKMDNNKKSLHDINKKYKKKRLDLGYKNTDDYIMKSNDINNKEEHEIQMINAKYTRAMYLYIIRNYYTIFSFQRSITNFINVTIKRGEFLSNQCKGIIQEDFDNKKEKKYLQLVISTFNKFGRLYNDPLYHGYFIIFVLKQRFCNDLVHSICDFI